MRAASGPSVVRQRAGHSGHWIERHWSAQRAPASTVWSRESLARGRVVPHAHGGVMRMRLYGTDTWGGSRALCTPAWD